MNMKLVLVQVNISFLGILFKVIFVLILLLHSRKHYLVSGFKLLKRREDFLAVVAAAVIGKTVILDFLFLFVFLGVYSIYETLTVLILQLEKLYHFVICSYKLRERASVVLIQPLNRGNLFRDFH